MLNGHGRMVLVAVLLVLTVGEGRADTLILRDFVLFDGTGTPPREVRWMAIRDGRIDSLEWADQEPSTVNGAGPDASTPRATTNTTTPLAPRATITTTLSLDGAFVMPGLIDTHVHFANYPPGHEELARKLEWTVRGGVTAVRDLGGDARVLTEARRAIAAGELSGPSIRIGAIFGGAAMFGHPALGQAARGFEPGQAPWLRAVGAGDELALHLAEARGAGVDAIKLYGAMEAVQVRRLIAEANRQGMMAWAHGTVFPARPSELVEAGVQSLSHAPYLIWEALDEVPDDYTVRADAPYADYPPDNPKVLRLLDRMAERGVVLDATLAMFRDMTQYRPAKGIEWAMEAFRWGVEVTRLAHRRGVPVAVGTDAFFPVNPRALPNTHIEMQTLVEDVGMTPAEALHAATAVGARAAGIDHERGTIAPGMIADLLVLERDATQDITATREIRYVIVEGRLVDD